MNLIKLIAYILFFGLMTSSCIGINEPEKPKDLIPEDHYVDILVEFQHIKTWRNARPDSVNADSLKQLVYGRYGITEQQFEETHTYYQQQVKEQLGRVEEAIKRLEAEKQYIQVHIDSVKAQQQADSVSVDSLP